MPTAQPMASSGTRVQAPKYHRADRPAGHSWLRIVRRVPGVAARWRIATTTAALSSANQGAKISRCRNW
ncbi:hypothetical protein OG422_08460 [Streptomyces sp. NBC_01525]|uniref:hypothetical protein n=1 Tax=Streptomyces sp. NBC_01525 TaxID=2903893 RepID=UPI00386970DB